MKRKGKIPTEFTIKITKEILKGRISYAEGASMAHVTWKSIEHWVAKYTSGGSKNLEATPQNARYSKELNKAAVLVCINGRGTYLK